MSLYARELSIPVIHFPQSLKKWSEFLRREAELARIEMDVRGCLSRTQRGTEASGEREKPAGQ